MPFARFDSLYQTTTSGTISFFGPWLSGLSDGTFAVATGPEVEGSLTIEVGGPGPISGITETMYVSTSTNLPVEAVIDQPAGQLTETYQYQSATAALSATADITPPNGFIELTPARAGAVTGPGVG